MSVTPRRRNRNSEEDDFDGPQSDGLDSGNTRGSKRARTASPDNGQLLPSSFLRSPPGSRANGTGAPLAKHQPGSIVRVTLTDFVTYTKAEFNPGPNLNMIIGPNGTGKSTLVCAICLGLAWPPAHLGRAKDIGEFVKHGAKRGTIEIELAADPARHRQNPVITTRITKEGNKAEFFVDGKKSTKKGVQELARSFSIQVDNLCQFLPQDRVVEFAALSPVDLLAQTQRAAAPEQMCEWHEQLKNMRREQKGKQDEQQRFTEDLKELENRHRLQEGDVTRLREREELTTRIAGLEKLRPFPEYKAATQRHRDAKARQKEASRELRLLERQMEPNLEGETAKQQYLERVEKVVASRRRLVERSDTMVVDLQKKQKTTEEKMEESLQEIDLERKAIKSTRQEMPRLEEEEKNLRTKMETAPPEFDSAEYNERIREQNRLYRGLTDEIMTNKNEMIDLANQGRQRQAQISTIESEKEALQTQAGQQANKLKQASAQAAKAWQWIQENRDRFEDTVYGPPIVECSVKDARHASAVESMISQGEMQAFTVTSQADFKTLTEALYRELRLSDINVRTSTKPLDFFRPPCSIEQLQTMGLDSWLIDLLEGPEPVLAMLCDNRNLHQTGFTTRNISNAQMDALREGSIISSWVTPKESCMITRRREYGPKATSARTNALRPARFFTDSPVDLGQESSLDRRIAELQRETAHFKEQIEVLKNKNIELNEQRQKAQAEEERIKGEKNDRQKSASMYAALPAKVEAIERKKVTAAEKIKASLERQRTIADEMDKLALQKGQQALDTANAIDALKNLHVQLIEAEIVAIEAKSDFVQLQARTREERRLIEERKKEVEELTAVSAQFLAAGQRLTKVCQDIGADFESDTVLEALYHSEVVHLDSEQLENEIQSSQARLDMTDGAAGGPRILQEYEERARKIERRRARLADIEATLQQLDTQIAEIREQWEPQLDQLVAEISEAFADNFAKIHCAGEVTVHKDEDFEAWAIQIKVKFREHEQLSILDSHRQSGGERAVSTIFYLMALQSLARAPFRVVDEINQGMDPRNERLVHSRMVDIACSENSASQYFLITPKLLNGLKYHPSMKVHCIASGEYMPKDYKELDFGMLAKKALALKGGVGQVAAAG